MAERYTDPDLAVRPPRPTPPAPGYNDRVAEPSRIDIHTSAGVNQPREMSGVRTRQGGLGQPVLWVLLIGLALAAIYLIGTQVWSTAEELPPAGQVEMQAPAPGDLNDPLLAPRAEPVPPAAVAPANQIQAPVLNQAPVTPAPLTPAPVTPAPQP